MQFHRALALFNRTRLSPGFPDDTGPGALEEELRMRTLEGQFLNEERARVHSRAQGAPSDANAFVHWFEALKHDGPGQGDPLFPFLAERATQCQMRWFLTQEVAGEAGFEDLTALTQLKMPAQAKLELGRNYWDELGRGHASGMHGPMLERLARDAGMSSELSSQMESLVWESLALGNLMVGLAANRRMAWQSIGALGVIELTAPTRAVLVNEGLKRLGMSASSRQYFALHATLDLQHSEAWNREVLHSLVKEDAERAQHIAEGALMRLHAGLRCFERYRLEFSIT